MQSLTTCTPLPCTRACTEIRGRGLPGPSVMAEGVWTREGCTGPAPSHSCLHTQLPLPRTSVLPTRPSRSPPSPTPRTPHTFPPSAALHAPRATCQTHVHSCSHTRVYVRAQIPKRAHTCTDLTRARTHACAHGPSAQPTKTYVHTHVRTPIQHTSTRTRAGALLTHSTVVPKARALALPPCLAGSVQRLCAHASLD